MVVTIKNKKQYLNLLLGECTLEQYEIERILTYLYVDEQLLHKTYFVPTITDCPRAIYMSFQKEPSFLFIKGKVKTDNMSLAYHELRLNNDEALYLQIDGCNPSSFYRLILENNPFLFQNNEKERFMNEIKLVKEKIDIALDRNDQEYFFTLTERLNKLIEVVEKNRR